MTPAGTKRIACASYFGLMLVIGLWELVLAPSRTVPPLFWFCVKEFPLVPAIYGLCTGSAYTFNWSNMLILLYLTDGLMLSVMSRDLPWSWHDPVLYGVLETAATLAFFAASLAYVRKDKAASAMIRARG